MNTWMDVVQAVRHLNQTVVLKLDHRTGESNLVNGDSTNPRWSPLRAILDQLVPNVLIIKVRPELEQLSRIRIDLEYLLV